MEPELAPSVTTFTVSYVSRFTLVEEGILLICIALIVLALLRGGPKRIHLLLWGFILLPARDVVFHLFHSSDYDSGRIWISGAKFLSTVGWLLIAGYCFTLVTKSSANTGQSQSPPSADQPAADG